MAGLVYGHRRFRNEKMLRYTTKKCFIGDFLLSNLGRYPVPLVHDLGQHGSMMVYGLHLCTSFLNFASPIGLFGSSADHLDYCLMNKPTDEDGATSFSNKWFRLLEPQLVPTRL